MARGRVLVSMNDDVLPEAGFLEAHVAGHGGAARPVIISGYSPFVRFEDETLFDALARDTSMIFFYDQMVRDGAPVRAPEHDWGFTARGGASSPQIAAPRGKALGGSSSVNATVAMRALPASSAQTQTGTRS